MCVCSPSQGARLMYRVFLGPRQQVCNTIRAIWTEDKSDITDEQYKDFYRFIANAYDDPTYR